ARDRRPPGRRQREPGGHQDGRGAERDQGAGPAQRRGDRPESDGSQRSHEEAGGAMMSTALRIGLVVPAALATACVSHKTGETEVGVLVCKISLGCSGKGVQQTVYAPGSTNFFLPWVRDFYTFDIKNQDLE